jgi:hypothetical protein
MVGAAPCLLALTTAARDYFLAHYWHLWLPLGAPLLVAATLAFEFSIVQARGRHPWLASLRPS